jgi:hypothetical protein
MFKIKDLNHKLSEFLSDKDLLSLTLINKYSYYHVFDEKYWKRKFNKYDYNIQFNIYNENWKKYYYLISKWLNEGDHIKSINFAIHEDRSDLLKMIYIRNKYQKTQTIYDWSGQNKDIFDPMTEIIEEDSVRCFDYIYDPSKYYTFLKIKHVILIHSHKILNYLSKDIKEDHAHLILKNNCEKCAENLINEKYTNYEFLNRIKNYEDIYKIYNKPFHNIIKCIQDIDQIKSRALEENNFELIKALTKYTSQFSDFIHKND